MTTFTGKFNKYAVDNDTISVDVEGFTVTATLRHDSESHIDDDDCHNIDQSVTGCNDKQQAKLLKARREWELCNWFYCGIVMSVSRNGIMLDDHTDSLWRIECNYPDSDNSYLTEAANDMIDNAVEIGKDILEKLKFPNS